MQFKFISGSFFKNRNLNIAIRNNDILTLKETQRGIYTVKDLLLSNLGQIQSSAQPAADGDFENLSLGQAKLIYSLSSPPAWNSKNLAIISLFIIYHMLFIIFHLQ